jgi:hypothetical protein
MVPGVSPRYTPLSKTRWAEGDMSGKQKVVLVMGVFLVVLLGLLIFTVVVYRRALANTQSQVKECLVLLVLIPTLFDQRSTVLS